MKQQLSYIITTEDTLLSWRQKTVMAPVLQRSYSSQSSKQCRNTFLANGSDIANSVALFSRSPTPPACPFHKSYIKMTVGKGRWWDVTDRHSELLGQAPACPVASFFTKRLTWTGRGWNSGLHCERRRLSDLLTGDNKNKKKKEDKKPGLY